MGTYKVIKDFPSRNGVEEYKAGEIIQLADNSRTKALMEMGYIDHVNFDDVTRHNSFASGELHDRIAAAVLNAGGFDEVGISLEACDEHQAEYKLTVVEKQ